MARMSEEQKKDLKMRLTLGALALAVVGPLLLAGPLLPKVVDRYRANPSDPNAPTVFYYAGKLMISTFRKEQGVAVLEDAYILFGDDHAVEDGGIEFTGELVEDTTFRGDEMGYYYLPWVVDRQPDGIRPEPSQVADRELIGKILLAVADALEDERKYKQCRHVYACLFHLWPEGSELHQASADARLRAIMRSYGE